MNKRRETDKNISTLEVMQLRPENHQQVQIFLDEVLHRSKLPGISVAMKVNGDTLEAVAGLSDVELNHPMTWKMRCDLGCLNKFLIAIVILELFNKGFIDIEKTISYYLPELRGRNGNIVKIRHLLSHTAGYQGENIADLDIAYDYTWEKFTRTFNQRPMLFKPGTIFDYSHSAAVILRNILEAVTQRNARDLIKEFITEPLGIKVVKNDNAGKKDCVSGHLFFPGTLQPQKSPPIGWCEFWLGSLYGLWITMQDLVKIGAAVVEDSSIFSSRTKDLLFRTVIKLPGRFVGKLVEQPYYTYSLGCSCFPNGSYGVRSISAGQCCALRFSRDFKLVIAVAINTNATYIRDYIVDKVWNAMFLEDVPIIPELSPAPLTKLEKKELAGTYQGSDHHSVNVTVENECLVMRICSNPAISNDTKAIALKWVKDYHGFIAPFNNSVPIGFFRDQKSKRIGLMVGDNAYKKVDKSLVEVESKIIDGLKEFHIDGI